MPFERPTITTITQRIEKAIEARLFSNLALLRNAILRILARVFAGAIHGNYGYLDWLSRQIFVTLSETFWLNQQGKMWGVNRRPGSFATGTAKFTGTNGITIPIDTRIQNEDGIEFTTTAIGVIAGGFVDIAIQAIEAGEDANIDIGTGVDLQMISPISGVDDTVPLVTSTTGGQDIEDDESYRLRILARIQQRPMGGAAQDYVQWATEVSGVARAWCYPTARGPGTVTTVITAQGSNPVPSPTLLTEVQDYIEERRPVTADQNVASITNIWDNPGAAEFDIQINLLTNEQTAEFKERIEENLRLLLEPHQPGTNILISQIREAIKNAGVSDFHIQYIAIDTIIRPQNADIELSGYQYCILHYVVYGTL